MNKSKEFNCPKVGRVVTAEIYVNHLTHRSSRGSSSGLDVDEDVELMSSCTGALTCGAEIMHGNSSSYCWDGCVLKDFLKSQ